FGDKAAPKPGTDDDIIGFNGAAMGDDALDAAIFDDQRLGWCIGETLELAGGFCLINQLAGNGLRARDDEARIRVPQTALHHAFFDQREFFLDLCWLHQARAGAESLARRYLALDFVHARIVADARHLDTADAGVVAHLFIEVDGIERRPAR